MAATPDDVDNVTPKEDDVSNVIQHFNYNLQQAAQLMCETVIGEVVKSSLLKDLNLHPHLRGVREERTVTR